MKHADKRLPSGRVMQGTEATCADTIALLSGVNLGSVVKVLAALEAIKLTVPMPPAAKIERVLDIPLSAPRFDGTEHQRVEGTKALVQRVCENPRVVYLDSILHLSSRFTYSSVASE